MITPTVSGMGDTGLSYQSKSLIQGVSMKGVNERQKAVYHAIRWVSMASTLLQQVSTLYGMFGADSR